MKEVCGGIENFAKSCPECYLFFKKRVAKTCWHEISIVDCVDRPGMIESIQENEEVVPKKC